MRTLAFDGRMGASGDMVLGALLAAGADREALGPVEATLDVTYRVRDVTRAGISATSVDVLRVTPDGEDQNRVAEDDEDADEAADDSSPYHVGHGHGHTHDGNHDHTHGEGHDHLSGHDQDHGGHGHAHAEGGGPHRTYAEVVEVVEGMDLPGSVESDALAVFEILGEAEAAVHGTDLASTHFHEVGADDAIADVVGACLLLADLDVDRVVTTPVAAGSGTVEMSHGTYPVPAPAVVEVVERADWAMTGGPVEAELLTPTGAAILAHVADGVSQLPALDLTSSGYGAGSRSFENHPNVLRALVGDGGGSLRQEEITVLETNLDDATPEVLGGLQETLVEAGARDVSIVPTTMKKSRPGHIVKVICKPEDASRLARALAEETGTLGVREHGAGHRWVADRQVETVTLDVDGDTHEVRIKVASGPEGAVYDVSAEYDDALAVARETGLAVREVTRRAEARWRAD